MLATAFVSISPAVTFNVTSKLKKKTPGPKRSQWFSEDRYHVHSKKAKFQEALLKTEGTWKVTSESSSPALAGNDLRNLRERRKGFKAKHTQKPPLFQLASSAPLQNQLFSLAQIRSSQNAKRAVKRACLIEFTHNESQGLLNTGLGQPGAEKMQFALTSPGSALNTHASQSLLWTQTTAHAKMCWPRQCCVMW